MDGHDHGLYLRLLVLWEWHIPAQLGIEIDIWKLMSADPSTYKRIRSDNVEVIELCCK